MGKDFVHLHLHTHYSLLDGAIKIKDLAKKAVEYGYKAVGLTDHGNIFGAVEFYQEMKSVGVKPIIGMESYFTNNRFEKKGEGSDDILTDKNYHLILFAKDKTGFKNLMKLSSLSYTEGFYYKPRIDWELLEKYHEGLICQTACLKGFIPNLLSKGQYEEAKKYAKRLKDIFGEDLYFEIQVNGLEEQEEANKGIIKLAKELGIKVVGTNDSHYLNPEDQPAHDVIKALQMKETLQSLQEKGKAFKVKGLHFTSPEEMYEKFKGYEEYLKNTMEIAEKCNVEIDTAETRGYLFPKYQIPGIENPTQEDIKAYFEKLSKEGLEKRLEKEKNLSKEKLQEYRERLQYEIDVINNMGFAEYFLIVQDFINYAKNNGIPVGPGRGSAGGSLVAYCLGITEIDPLKHGLIFERFLNPERISMPDIDVDFCMENREKVIRYVKDKYGEDSVAQIITFNFMKSKMVIRDVARVLGFPYQEADKIAKMILPGPIQGSTLTIDENLEANPDFRKLYETDPKVKQLLDLARKLEGSARHTGIHAAGIVIAPGPLDEYVPVYRDKDGNKATQFEMKTLEQLGLVKMDFLGLKTLTELDLMKKLIKERHGIEINYQDLPLDDENVYKLLQSGKTTGVFQLESKGMQDLLVRLKPTVFDEIIAILALFRPGPLMSGMVDEYIERKHGRKPIEYPFEEVKEVLKETYGLIVYQEQIMFMSNILSGFSMAEADTLRKAIGKKNPETMAKMKGRFVEGAVERGFDREKVEKLWDDIEKFASYSFNKSHSTAYAYLTYWTAWVKTYYTDEFFAVKLSTEVNDSKFLNLLIDMENFGIKLLPPDVNKSMAEFYIESPKNIRFGLARIKNVGESSAKEIVKEREKNGEFVDIFDFCERLDTKTANKRVLESLIKAGAFDFEKVDRAILLNNVDKAISSGQKARESKMAGQNSLFALTTTPVVNVKHTYEDTGIKKLTEREKLKYEKEVLGFYLSGHPINAYKKELKGKVAKIGEIYDLVFSGKRPEGDLKVKFAGVVDEIKLKKTKSGNTMMMFSFSDETGQIDCRAFPEKLENKDLLKDDNIVVLEGFIEIDDEQEKISMNVVNVEPIENFLKDIKGVKIKIPKEKAMNGLLPKLQQLFKEHRGDKDVVIHIYDRNFECEIQLHSDFCVNLEDEFKHKLLQYVAERDVMYF
ncbi:DNA polymerase III subunit alpha [Sulfurihydrogenibium azorense Az-Fu1]|uniref:DNA polymerase III subunit alpha n=1 Tax=Sulfurihydrogenibium azorense (strain DSM 15241 / OCM 825 / Az-Fu1) TaxID=204536 RepID=C1DXC6_SULAA|nr:DNA polymerase III subunit alpha [Sulfurihydrogenibium azorense]ACN98642.1 DNA polymerase III subunit alpha [Sulfurihydrogenibium azorense Az-Fu1]